MREDQPGEWSCEKSVTADCSHYPSHIIVPDLSLCGGTAGEGIIQWCGGAAHETDWSWKLNSYLRLADYFQDDVQRCARLPNKMDDLPSRSRRRRSNLSRTDRRPDQGGDDRTCPVQIEEAEVELARSISRRRRRLETMLSFSFLDGTRERKEV
jgi:hypothetical protein